MTIFRVYDPAECDERGVPLDWERCRLCHSSFEDLPHPYTEVLRPGLLRVGSRTSDWGANVSCPSCDGHGSLKDAALSLMSTLQWAGKQVDFVEIYDAIVASPPVPGTSEHAASMLNIRCEACRHPMGDGEWLGKRPAYIAEGYEHLLVDGAIARLGAGDRAYEDGEMAYYSPCDSKCRHDGSVLVRGQGMMSVDQMRRHWHPNIHVEASWRQVDVRTLGWPHDLRPEQLATLCLRCWAKKVKSYACS